MNKRIFTRILPATALLLMVFTVAGISRGFEPELTYAEGLLGKRIADSSGKAVGQIEDLVLEVGRGERVVYVLVSYGGSVESREELFAVPYALLQTDGEADAWALPLPVRELRQGPSFNRREEPDFADPLWQRRIDDFYGPGQSRPGGDRGAYRYSSQRPGRRYYDRRRDDDDRRAGRYSSPQDRYAWDDRYQYELDRFFYSYPFRYRYYDPDMYGNGNRYDMGYPGDEYWYEYDYDPYRHPPYVQRERRDGTSRMYELGRRGDSLNGRLPPSVRRPDRNDLHQPTRRLRRNGPEKMKLTDIIGRRVVNADNRDMGDLEHVLIDVHEGVTVFAELSSGSAWGQNAAERVPVPWELLTVTGRFKPVQTGATVRELKFMAYDPAGKRPDYSDLSDVDYIYQFFGVEPYYEDRLESADIGYLESSPWKADSWYNRQFDTENRRVVKGTITSVARFIPEHGASPGLRLRVKTGSGRFVTVHAGPLAFVNSRGVLFAVGKEVEVSGSEINFDNRSVIMAEHLQYDGESIQVREPDGKPAWDLKLLMSDR